MRVYGNDKNLCQEAKEYYYEILCRDGIVVPEAVTRHVESCSFCQEQIRRLGDTFVQADVGIDSPGDVSDTTSLDALNRQFEFLGETVTCSHVRPFLPDLLVSSTRVRIPTPITVHVENCPQCTKDLAAIGKLGLSDDQLGRLGRFYEQSLFGEVSDEACDANFECGSRDARPCEEISTADLFDCILPCDPDAGGDETNERHDTTAAHIRACRSCRGRAQSLRRTIQRIAERADSGVHTLYRCQTDEELVRDASGASVHQYPVHVQIQRPEPARSGLRRQPRVRLRKKPLLQGAALAAAFVLVGSLFLFQSSTATGKTVGDLLRVVRNKPNVHITTSSAVDPLMRSEIWISSDLNKIATRMGEKWAQYDLNKKSMSGTYLGLEPGVSVPLQQEQMARCIKYMEEPLWNELRNVQPGDNLAQADSVASDRPGVSLSVYELTRERRTSNGTRMWTRLRTFIDPGLESPVKIEFSSRMSENLEWELETTTHLSYPTTPEMESELKALLPSE